MSNKIKTLLKLINLKLRYWITKLVGYIANLKIKWVTRLIITIFICKYKINMQESQETNIMNYPTFNSFFIRKIRYKLRPIDYNPKVIVSPADGIISQFGFIKTGNLFQAKSIFYSLKMLLANHLIMTNYFSNGTFFTIYLSPNNYHRVHMPCNGILREMMYIPGNLFSLNPINITRIPNLFANNERVVCFFNTDFGIVAQILIGAIIVGSIETIWNKKITLNRTKNIRHWYYHTKGDKAIILKKGEEMGRFKLGSTVISLFNNKNFTFNKQLFTRYTVHVGQKLAYIVNK